MDVDARIDRLHNVPQIFVFVLQIHFVGMYGFKSETSAAMRSRSQSSMMLPRLLPQLLALNVSSNLYGNLSPSNYDWLNTAID